MSVVFQNMDFGNDSDSMEYLFVNDFGNLDDLTLARVMTMVAKPIRTSPVYNVRDGDVAPVQAPDHLLLPPDAPPIVPDLLDIKNCTRQLELYNQVCMEIQDVDAQPLRYGRHAPVMLHTDTMPFRMKQRRKQDLIQIEILYHQIIYKHQMTINTS